MNGSVMVRNSISDEFRPQARLNSHASDIAIVTLSDSADVTVYSADEARRYAAAFAEAARLLDNQAFAKAAADAGRRGSTT